MKKFIISIDQGTTSSRVILFDSKAKIVFKSQFEFKQYFRKNGWVEHDPKEIWSTTIKALKKVIKKASKLNGKIISIGITNQRETTIMWDKRTGKPVYNAIVWQDRRTQKYCNLLKSKKYEISQFALLEVVFTFISFVGFLIHEAAKTLSPSTSTIQALQFPSAL